jgi:hypothetical protein
VFAYLNFDDVAAREFERAFVIVDDLPTAAVIPAQFARDIQCVAPR